MRIVFLNTRIIKQVIIKIQGNRPKVPLVITVCNVYIIKPSKNQGNIKIPNIIIPSIICHGAYTKAIKSIGNVKIRIFCINNYSAVRIFAIFEIIAKIMSIHIL